MATIHGYNAPQIISTGIFPPMTEKRKVTKQVPYACPVCLGKGEIGQDKAQYEAQPKYVGVLIYACHVCNGSCLIWEIREEEEEVVPQTIFPQMPNIGLPSPILAPYTTPWVTGINDRIIGVPGDPLPEWGKDVNWTTNKFPGMDQSSFRMQNEANGKTPS